MGRESVPGSPTDAADGTPWVSESDGTPPTERGAPSRGASRGSRRESASLAVVEPSVPRDAVESDGRVGAVAYPYRVYEASATVERRFLSARELSYVASVDRTRRLVLRADVVPEVETRIVADVLVLPADLPDRLCRERARDTVVEWTTRQFALGSAPTVDLERELDAYKLFWLAERDGGDVVVDSVSGEESPLDA